MKFLWIILALSAAVASAVVVVLSKAGIKKVDPSLAFAIQAVLIVTISWTVVLFQKKQVGIASIDARTWVYLIAAGIVTTLSSLLTFRALKLGDAGAVSPLTSLSLVFSILFATLFLKEKITWQLLTGAVLMVTGAVIIAVAKKNTL